ncbi:hypothetical protein [Candidatus Methylomirabilis limnetica]|uniref:hypothetical protein n=1 Tax=Candidatus Methylomirabilis limnetica TaxID=2033718 RepID=UPI0010574D81|nr:hypothetical protein [Candidatus Methylomirabilis limnetica]
MSGNIKAKSASAIGLLPPETAVVKHNLAPIDIIAKPEAAEGESPLAFANRHIHELLDTIGSVAVVRVGLENVEGSALKSLELQMASEEAPSQSLEP